MHIGHFIVFMGIEAGRDKNYFRPEFLNRVDDIVVFSRLSKDDLRHIVDIQFAAFADRLEARRIDVELSDEAANWLADNGYDPSYGARPLKRLMHKEALKIMQRYMAAIYSMTSVNHDHLFASLLRFSPHKKFKEHALRRKLFLLTGAVREVKNLYLHQNLQDDQVHLLTDDRYGRVSDFLSVAIEKEILKREGRYLIKDRSKFSSPYDFHRARIDNPVEVMANAVEPLTALQRVVRWTAWLPDIRPSYEDKTLYAETPQQTNLYNYVKKHFVLRKTFFSRYPVEVYFLER